jgi:hypothetical protein
MRELNATLLAATALLSGCGDAGGVETVGIAAHYVPACAPLAGSGPTRVELVALGDFDRSNDSVSILDSDAALTPVTLPEATRAVELATLGASAYWGSGTRAAGAPLDVLLWPQEDACALAASELESGMSAGDVALGVVQRPFELVLAGAALELAGGEGGPLAVDLGSGEVSGIEAPEAARRSRRGATLSALGDGLLLAGGVDAMSGEPLASAFVYDAETRSFLSTGIGLSAARARHAALGLPTGESLLIGGQGADGTALASAEVVFAERARGPALLPLLADARIAPSVVPFAGGRFLVGGGYTLDGSGAEPRSAVASVEILSIDLSRPPAPPLELRPAALDRAFVTLGPAGALAVGGCSRESRPSDCVACGADGRGCVSREVWWLDQSGALHALEPLADELAAARPLLGAAGEGAPWLIAGSRLARFDPWQGRFVRSGPALAEGHAAGRALGVGPGLFVWLTQADSTLLLSGFKHGQRDEFSQDVAPLLVGDAQRLIPHRPASDTNADAALLHFELGSGLELRGSEAAVSVADTTYTDVTLELSLAEGPAPLVRFEGLRGTQSESEVFGALDCPWPVFQPPTEGAGEMRLRVERRGDRVRLSRVPGPGLAEEAAPACVRPLPERVEVQLVGTALGTTRLTRLEVHRF